MVARSRCHQLLGRHRKAMQDVESALSLDPLYYEVNESIKTPARFYVFGGFCLFVFLLLGGVFLGGGGACFLLWVFFCICFVIKVNEIK